MQTILAKFRNAIIDNRKVLLVLFTALLIGAVIWLYDATQPVNKYEDVTISTYTQEGAYTYSAQVTKTNPLFAVNTTLEMGHPAYFYVVSPELDMSFAYRLKTSDDAKVNGSIDTIVVASGRQTEGDIEKVYWIKEFPIKSKKFKIGNEDRIENNFSINVSDIRTNVEDMKKELGYDQDAEIEIVNRVTYSGRINGKSVTNVTEFINPLVLTDAYYQLPGEMNLYVRTDTNMSKLVEKPPSATHMAMPSLLLVVSLISFIYVLSCWRAKKVEPEALKALEKEQEYANFKDSISRGKLPEDMGIFTKIEIASLKELVDAAIDMNSRVIYDAEAKICFMINNDIIYTYAEKG